MLLKSCLCIPHSGTFSVSSREKKMYFAVSVTAKYSSSPKKFDNLLEALCWILLNNCRLPFVLHLLNDFLLIDYPHSKPDCCISALRRTFARLGVPLD